MASMYSGKDNKFDRYMYKYLTIRREAYNSKVARHNLGKTPYVPRYQHWHGGQCAICLEDYEAGDEICEPECGHFLHAHCFYEDTIMRSNLRCAICRKRLFSPWISKAVQLETRLICQRPDTDKSVGVLQSRIDAASEVQVETLQNGLYRQSESSIRELGYQTATLFAEHLYTSTPRSTRSLAKFREEIRYGTAECLNINHKIADTLGRANLAIQLFLELALDVAHDKYRREELIRDAAYLWSLVKDWTELLPAFQKTTTHATTSVVHNCLREAIFTDEVNLQPGDYFSTLEECKAAVQNALKYDHLGEPLCPVKHMCIVNTLMIIVEERRQKQLETLSLVESNA